MHDQVLDFRHAITAIGRRWRLLSIVFVLGMGAGVALLVRSTPVYRARAQVLLPPPPVDAQGHDLRDAKTEAYIIGSAQVLDAAGQSLNPQVSTQALRARIHVRALSSQIEEIAADAPSPDDAARLANAVAVAYVAANDSAASGTANLATSLLAAEQNRLTEQIKTLDAQITADTATLKGLAPADAQREATVVDSLRSQEASLTQQLITIQSRIADAQLSTELSRRGTRLLQPATAPTQPAQLRPPLILGGAALASLLVGAIAAIALEQGDRRLRVAKEIALTAGAPVLASLAAPKALGKRDSLDLLTRWEPTVVDDLAVRKAFARLEFDNARPANLVVVTLADDETAVALPLELALYSAATSTRTAFVFGTHHDSNADLRAACLALEAAGTPMPYGLAVFGAGGDLPRHMDGFDLSITSIVAESGPVILPTWDRPTVTALALSTRPVAKDRVEAVTAACMIAGVPLAGVFFARPTVSRGATKPAKVLPSTAGQPVTTIAFPGVSPRRGRRRKAAALDDLRDRPVSGQAPNGRAVPGKGANGRAVPGKAASSANGNSTPAKVANGRPGSRKVPRGRRLG